MPVYRSSDELYASLKFLFDQIKALGSEATRSVTDAKMVIRFRISDPPADVLIDGRQKEVRFSYGINSVKPNLDVELSGDVLHKILLAELPLRKALGSGQMKVRGQIWKARALEDVFHHGQALYPTMFLERKWEAAQTGGE
jgi:hypothetical protein